MSTAKSKILIASIVLLIISMFGSGFVWQHVIPDLDRHYEPIRTTLNDGSSAVVGYKSVVNDLAWLIIPACFILIALNVIGTCFTIAVATWEEWTARNFLDSISLSKVFKTGLKKP